MYVTSQPTYVTSQPTYVTSQPMVRVVLFILSICVGC